MDSSYAVTVAPFAKELPSAGTHGFIVDKVAA
jgi:hypothetical protein